MKLSIKHEISLPLTYPGNATKLIAKKICNKIIVTLRTLS